MPPTRTRFSPRHSHTFQLCECQRCELVALDTPQFSFFVIGGPPWAGLPLICEGCVREWLASRGSSLRKEGVAEA